jgi:archaellum component FlaC
MTTDLAILAGIATLFIAALKVIPERTNIITGYQLKTIKNLQSEVTRLTETVARLENEVIEPLKGRAEKLEKVVEEVTGEKVPFRNGHSRAMGEMGLL